MHQAGVQCHSRGLVGSHVSAQITAQLRIPPCGPGGRLRLHLCEHSACQGGSGCQQPGHAVAAGQAAVAAQGGMLRLQQTGKPAPVGAAAAHGADPWHPAVLQSCGVEETAVEAGVVRNDAAAAGQEALHAGAIKARPLQQLPAQAGIFEDAGPDLPFRVLVLRQGSIQAEDGAAPPRDRAAQDAQLMSRSRPGFSPVAWQLMMAALSTGSPGLRVHSVCGAKSRVRSGAQVQGMMCGICRPAWSADE